MPLLTSAAELGCALIDLDGCLCNCDHRLSWAFIEDWDKFHSRCLDDDPYPEVAELLRGWAARGGRIAYVTARTEPYREMTLEWLRIHLMPDGLLFMREAKDIRHSHELKAEMLDRIATQFGPVAFAMDDQDSVVQMYRKAGVVCLQPRPRVY